MGVGRIKKGLTCNAHSEFDTASSDITDESPFRSCIRTKLGSVPRDSNQAKNDLETTMSCPPATTNSFPLTMFVFENSEVV